MLWSENTRALDRSVSRFCEAGAPCKTAALQAKAFRLYQPETQFAFFVDRLAFVNLYSTPTEMAKFTSYCA